MTNLLDIHEDHGGDETPKPSDCEVCRDDVDYFLRWGTVSPLSLMRCSECGTLLDDGVCTMHGPLEGREGMPEFNGAFR